MIFESLISSSNLIRFQSAIRLVVLAISFALSGCFPWPSGGEDPEPVELESVATSEIRVNSRAAIYEETDNFVLTVSFSNSDQAPLLLDSGSSMDFQILDDQGMYRSLDAIEEYLPESTYRFTIDEYSAPATYQLMLSRSNGEEVELLNFTLKAKFQSNSTIENTATFGNGDSAEFDWGFYDEDEMIDIYHQGGLHYTLKCANEDFIGHFDIERNTGIKASPYFQNIDDLVPQSFPIEYFAEDFAIEFPCTASIRRSYILSAPENDYKILSGYKGSETALPGQIGNGAGLSVNVVPKTYEIVIYGN